jgi:ribosomal protein S21
VETIKEKDMEVFIKNSSDEKEFDKAVKLFKKIVMKSGILEEVKERRYYQKPSDKAREIKRTRKPYKEN